MADYDSILKEKKTYEEPISKNTEPVSFPWFQVDLILISLIIAICYIVYFNIVLTPKNIFLNDLKIVSNKYQSILKPIELSILNNKTYNLKGTISINKINYNYNLSKDNNKINLTLNKDDLSLNYYTISKERYIKLSNFNNEYYKLSNTNSSNTVTSLNNYLTNNLTEDKFIKKFYIKGTDPIVESNLILNNEDLLAIFNLSNIDNSYKVLLTFKNHAISNEIVEIKVIVNNLTTNERTLITYDNKYIIYKDDNNSLKFELIKDNEDFRLNTYKDDILYSVLTGTRKETNYQYLYQIIDEIYNLTLNVNKENNLTSYSFFSNIEKNSIIETKNLILTLEANEEVMLENTDISNAIDYDSLTKEEKKLYKNSLNDIIKELR